MRKTKRIIIICIAVIFALCSMPLQVIAKSDYDPTLDGDSKYAKPDISDLTGLGGNPSEMTALSNADAVEKEWYEYIAYCNDPVGILSLSGTSSKRLVFFDPYSYGEAMIMEVNEDVSVAQSGYTTANSISISYTKSSTYSVSYSDSQTNTSSIQYPTWEASETFGKEASITGSTDVTVGTSVKETILTSVESSASATASAGTPGIASVGTEVGTSVGTSVGVELEQSVEASVGLELASTTSSEITMNLIAERITSTTGVASTYTRDYLSSQSTTVTTTYDAAHFQENGNPYSWKVMAYTIKMPLYCELQYNLNGEWVTVDSDYVILTTLHGTCRSWIQNSSTYYEHWGTGEPVTYNDFWKQFFTEASLKAAYQNKLYPDSY